MTFIDLEIKNQSWKIDRRKLEKDFSKDSFMPCGFSFFHAFILLIRLQHIFRAQQWMFDDFQAALEAVVQVLQVAVEVGKVEEMEEVEEVMDIQFASLVVSIMSTNDGTSTLGNQPLSLKNFKQHENTH